MFKLTIEDDEGKTTVVPLAREEMTIGRLDGNTIRLTERNISRKHARLVRQNGAIYIEDLTSFTGVRVNGTKIAALTPLREGDEVQIGDYKLALKGEQPAVPVGDRATVPTMAAVGGPMGTVGGSVAIPTRASVAAMSAQPAHPMSGASTITAPLPMVRVGPPASPPPIPTPAPAPPVSPGGGAKTPGPVPAMVTAPQSPTILRRGQRAPEDTPAPVPQLHPFAATAAPLAGAPVAAPAPAFPPPAADEAAVPEVSEAQPTIPLRALGDTVVDQTATPVPARLFVVTTDLAGREVPLDRASLVIGRTDENDVVLNHRSISRHHAKIVRDGDNYTIVDLQSANGVRVNGEDYERIELHAGDIIELGHVKLRFVGPNEDYIFDPNADLRPVRRRTVPVKYVALGAGVLSLLVVAVVLRRPHGGGGFAEEPTSLSPVPAAAPASAPLPVPVSPPVAEPIPPPSSGPPVANAPAALLDEAQQAVAAEDWERARTALERMGPPPTLVDPVLRRDVLLLRRRVELERKGAVAFAEFDEAASSKSYADALARYDQIPVESVYKRRGKARYDEARTLLVAEHLASAEQARAAGHCADVRTEAAAVARLDPKNTIGREMVRLCRPTRPEPVAAPAVAARPARLRPTQAAAEPAPRVERVTSRETAHVEPAAAEEAGDPEVLMKQARESWLRQQCGAAIDLSRKALRARPGLTDAYQIIAVCSCTLKDADAANRAYLKLDDKNRSLVRSLCQKNGVTLGGE